MKHRIVAFVLLGGLALIAAAIVVYTTRRTPPRVVLPNPNGYDDFTLAAQALTTWSGDLPTLSPEAIRGVVSQNAKTLEAIHQGLKKESAMPVINDMNWLVAQMPQTVANKRMAQLLVAEGMVRLQEGRTNEAARSFADCVLFGHAAHRHGLMIHELVTIACQTIGSRQLLQVAPHVSAEALQAILPDLLALEHGRDSATAIIQRDRAWGRGANGLAVVLWHNIALRSQTRKLEKSFEKKEARSVASLRLVIAELAVRGYQAKIGRLPSSLADLIPAWLPAVPLDPFSNRPLVYRLTTNSFQLYSVGPDGKDDLGTPLKRGEPEVGDLLPNSG